MVCRFESGVPSGRTNNYPESGRGLGHETLTIFGSTVGYPSDSLASCLCSNCALSADGTFDCERALTPTVTLTALRSIQTHSHSLRLSPF